MIERINELISQGYKINDAYKQVAEEVGKSYASVKMCYLRNKKKLGNNQVTNKIGNNVLPKRVGNKLGNKMLPNQVTGNTLQVTGNKSGNKSGNKIGNTYQLVQQEDLLPTSRGWVWIYD